MKQRSSLCVGGPWDGRSVAHDSPQLHVAYRQDVYTYYPVYGCNVLVHESLYNTGPDWQVQLMQKILEGYRSVSYQTN